MVITKILMILLAVVFHVHGMLAQTPIAEYNVPMTILKWHYVTFPRSTDPNWFKLTEDNAKYFEVNFKFRNSLLLARYNDAGTIQFHKAALDPIDLPKTVVGYLASNYKKFKILAFNQVFTYESKHADPLVEFEIKLKERGKSHTLKFDKFFNPVLVQGTFATSN